MLTHQIMQDITAVTVIPAIFVRDLYAPIAAANVWVVTLSDAAKNRKE